MQSSMFNRRDFMKLSAVTGIAALPAAILPKFSMAEAVPVKLSGVVEMSPEEMAKNRRWSWTPGTISK